MLVLRRREQQYVDVTHKSGDSVRVSVRDIRRGQANLTFEDPERNFSIQRPERRVETTAVLA